MRSSATLLCVLAALALATGCSKGEGGSGSSGGSSGTSGDAGPRDAGPTPCTTDTECTAPEVCDAQPGGSGFCGPKCEFDDLCPAGTRCEEASGHCVAAAACDDGLVGPVDACAESNSGASYCPDDGDRCRCTTADGGRGAGVCRRVRTTCSPCTDASQCNPCPEGTQVCDQNNHVYPSTCAAVGDAGTYCLRTTGTVNCPFGYVQDQASGTCQPAGGVCEGFAPCRTDSDCAAGNYCDTRTGICKANCSFEYNSGTSLGCAPGQVCNVLPADVLSDAGLARYGQGTCGLPCDQAGGANCETLGAQAGLQFACVQERSGEHRCRPVSLPDGGGCMNDIECPRPNDGGPYLGYCSIYEFGCRYDCRDGIDPLSGAPYANHDCVAPVGSSVAYKCQDNQCVEKNCVERGGAGTDALPNQFCCGEDRDHTGYDGGFADISHPANACAPGVDAGEYFDAPAPPWCNTGCQQGTQQFDDGGFVVLDFATCSVDAGFPNFDPLGAPNLCIKFGQNDPPECMIAAKYISECPHNWILSSAPAGCQDDSECQYVLDDAGISPGHCVIYPDGGGGFCGCDQDEVVDGGYLLGDECPPQSRCEQHKRCIYTRGCQPTHLACSAVP